MRAHPDCNLDRLTELSFEFDQTGKIVDCIGTIKARPGPEEPRGKAARHDGLMLRKGPVASSMDWVHAPPGSTVCLAATDIL